jgi:hypothetical protein
MELRKWEEDDVQREGQNEENAKKVHNFRKI